MRKKELNQHVKVKKRVVALFIGNLTKKGNKFTGKKIFDDAIFFLKKRIKSKDPFRLLLLAVRRISPSIRLRNKRFGALVHKLPYFLPPSKAKSYAIRWIVEGAQNSNINNLGKAMSNEVVNSLKKTGYAWRKKIEVHKIALANRPYMRIR